MSDAAFEKRAERWPESTPDTKEAYFIRDVFDSASLPSSRNDLLSYDFALRAPPSPRRHVPPGCSRDRRQVRSRDPVFLQSPFWCANVALTVIVLPARWIPRGDWGCSSDPSGRSVSIHNAAYADDEATSS